MVAGIVQQLNQAPAQVCQSLDVSISVGERLHTRWEFVPVFEQKLADFAIPDVTWGHHPRS